MLNEIKPSKEQKIIIETLAKDKNIIVNAVAGSGKSTTILFYAKQNPNEKILILTYNKKLQIDTKEKIKLWNLLNVEVYTYHAYASKIFKTPIHNNLLFKKALESHQKIFIKNFDVLCLDEFQDVNEIFVKFIYQIENNFKKLIIFGDPKQTIYKYNGSDEKYLQFFDKLIQKDFVFLSLKETFRCPPNITYFINKYLLKENLLISKNKKIKGEVKYFSLENDFKLNKIFDFFLEMLNKGYQYSDFFVLSPSLKQGIMNPMKRLENFLAEINIPVYFSKDDEEILKEDLVKNKVVFTTFHQSKGLERKVVIVFAFSSSFFIFNNSNNLRWDVLPNELYVATTRAKEVLALVEWDSNFTKQGIYTHLPFIDIKKLSQDIKHITFSEEKNRSKQYRLHPNLELNKKEVRINLNASEAGKHLNDEVVSIISEAIAKLTEIHIAPQYNLDIQNVYVNKTLNTQEDVSIINSSYLTWRYLEHIEKINIIDDSINKIKHFLNVLGNEHLKKYKEELEKIDMKNNSKASLLKKTIFLVSWTSELMHLFNQIPEANWLEDFKGENFLFEKIDQLIEKGKNILEQDISFEVIENFSEISISNSLDNFKIKNLALKKFWENNFNYPNLEKPLKFKMGARIDLIANEKYYEIKCTNNLSFEHKLQTIIYMFIINNLASYFYKQKNNNNLSFKEVILPECKSFHLLNIKTGELLIFKNNQKIINEIMKNFFYTKYLKNILEEKTISKEEFILKNKK